MNLRKLAPVTIISMLSLLPSVLALEFASGFSSDNPAMEKLDVFGWGFASTIVFFSVIFAIVLGVQYTIHNKLKKAGLDPILGGKKTVMGMSGAFALVLVASAYIPMPSSIIGILGAAMVGVILINVIVLALVGMEFKVKSDIVSDQDEAIALAIEAEEGNTRFAKESEEDEMETRNALREEVKELHEVAQIVHHNHAIAELLEGKLGAKEKGFSLVNELKKLHQDVIHEQFVLSDGKKLQLAETTLLSALTEEKAQATGDKLKEFNDIEVGLKREVNRLRKEVKEKGIEVITEAKKSLFEAKEIREATEELIKERKETIDKVPDNADTKEDRHRHKKMLKKLEEFLEAITVLEKEIKFIEEKLEDVEEEEGSKKVKTQTRNAAKKARTPGPADFE